MAGPSSTQIDFRPTVNPTSVISEPWQTLHSKAKLISVEKMLLNRKHVSDKVLKDIDFT